MVTFRQVPYLILALASLTGATSESSLAQDREGRIETTTERIETRRRLQQYMNEERPAAAPLVLPSQPVAEPQARRPQARTTATRAPASAMTFATDGASRAETRARPKPKPRIVRPAPLTATPRQSLPRD
jgi:hypothetical protein